MPMTLRQLIEKKKAKAEERRAALKPKLDERDTHTATIAAIREKCEAEESRDPSQAEADQIREAQARKAQIDAETAGERAALDQVDAEIAELEKELAADEAADDQARRSDPTGTRAPEHRAPVTIGREERTYREDEDPKGVKFLSDVAAQFMYGGAAVKANERLSRHMEEEHAERGEKLEQMASRAAGSGAFAGLVVPQYLTDLYAPKARAGRPFADACRHHDLPETGLTVYIGKVTTGTSADVQSAEFDTVSETDIDDTLMSVPVQTAAGSQTLSRQAVDRGVGVEDTTMEDLFGAYGTNLDGKLLNQATNGLTNVATSITYTDASPTAAELYPKLVKGPADVEAAMLDQAVGDTLAVMHSRRWYWLQSQLTSTWPMFGQTGVAPQNVGVDFGKAYGSGFRGVLPTGVPVIVDNNIATNLGTGTNEDEVYFAAQSECHLWEDPDAPMLIRAEQSQVKKLAIDFVAYGYFAYTFVRRPNAQKVIGTGLVTPAFA